MENSDPFRNKNSLNQLAGEKLCMNVRKDLVPLFIRLLSQGMVIFIQAGVSVRELLCGQLGIREGYLDTRIQTVFLNSKPVDDVEATIVENGSTLALSGPMPGLVGATMRRGGFFSGMRSQISYDNTLSSAQKNSGKIVLKLFNLVAKELGPTFLQNGLWIPGKRLKQFIHENLDNLQPNCMSVNFDGRTLDLEELVITEVNDALVFLQLSTDSKA